MYAHSNSSWGLYVEGATGRALNADGDIYQKSGSIFAADDINAMGNLHINGTKSAVVKLKDGTPIRLFAEEAAEVYFNDYGEGTLSYGKSHIELDPIYLQTVTINDKHPMKVFVQLNDDCKGIFVSNRTGTGFDVVELQGGISNAHFTYRVICKRMYYEDERLATEEQAKLYTKQMMETI